jgi:hypothetical protein
MRTTRYFEEQVLRKRPYIQREWCEQALKHFVAKEKQADGRFRYWMFVPELGKHLRVVTLEDGETVHNAFPDREFKETSP